MLLYGRRSRRPGGSRGQGRPVAGFQPMPGMVDTPHEVFVFHGAELIGEPTDAEEAALIEWVPLTRIAGLIQPETCWVLEPSLASLQS